MSAIKVFGKTGGAGGLLENVIIEDLRFNHLGLAWVLLDCFSEQSGSISQ